MSDIKKAAVEFQTLYAEKHNRLIKSILENLGEAQSLKERLENDWQLPNHFYRFYHQSFKTYKGQSATLECFELFQKIAGNDFSLDKWFVQIINEGTNGVFDLTHNDNWLIHTRPIIEAMLHAKFFLDLIVCYGHKMKTIKTVPAVIDNGWAALLYLFSIR